MKPKVLFTYDYGEANFQKVKELGYEVLFIKEEELECLEELREVEVIVCYNPFSKIDIRQIENLRWIQLISVGVNHLPIEYLKLFPVLVTNNKGGYSTPIGEWVVMQILQLLKKSREFFAKQEKKLWQLDNHILELSGKTVGFIGTGRIAQETAKRLQGFNVQILGLNTTGKEVKPFSRCFSQDQRNELLAQCEIVVLTIPSTKETFQFIGEKEIEVMKDGAFLINVARGDVVDEKALIAGLNCGKIKGAALDVVEEEPLGKESSLWEMENVILTPHNSWISEQNDDRNFQLIYQNMERYLKGAELENKVDLKKGY